jgi:ribulose 1,5-bisphosphate synthetase/thiazole synthase
MGHPCWLSLQLTGWFVLIDARTVPANNVIEADVCIVGAGAVGITLAREFISIKIQLTSLFQKRD